MKRGLTFFEQKPEEISWLYWLPVELLQYNILPMLPTSALLSLMRTSTVFYNNDYWIQYHKNQFEALDGLTDIKEQVIAAQLYGKARNCQCPEESRRLFNQLHQYLLKYQEKEIKKCASAKPAWYLDYLGKINYFGLGVQSNEKHGLKLLMLGFDLGSLRAAITIARVHILFAQQDFREIDSMHPLNALQPLNKKIASLPKKFSTQLANRLEQAYHAGMIEAAELLTVMYRHGIFVSRNHEEATIWFNRIVTMDEVTKATFCFYYEMKDIDDKMAAHQEMVEKRVNSGHQVPEEIPDYTQLVTEKLRFLKQLADTHPTSGILHYFQGMLYNYFCGSTQQENAMTNLKKAVTLGYYQAVLLLMDTMANNSNRSSHVFWLLFAELYGYSAYNENYRFLIKLAFIPDSMFSNPLTDAISTLLYENSNDISRQIKSYTNDLPNGRQRQAFASIALGLLYAEGIYPKDKNIAITIASKYFTRAASYSETIFNDFIIAADKEYTELLPPLFRERLMALDKQHNPVLNNDQTSTSPPDTRNFRP